MCLIKIYVSYEKFYVSYNMCLIKIYVSYENFMCLMKILCVL